MYARLYYVFNYHNRVHPWGAGRDRKSVPYVMVPDRNRGARPGWGRSWRESDVLWYLLWYLRCLLCLLCLLWYLLWNMLWDLLCLLVVRGCHPFSDQYTL